MPYRGQGMPSTPSMPISPALCSGIIGLVVGIGLGKIQKTNYEAGTYRFKDFPGIGFGALIFDRPWRNNGGVGGGIWFGKRRRRRDTRRIISDEEEDEDYSEAERNLMQGVDKYD